MELIVKWSKRLWLYVSGKDRVLRRVAEDVKADLVEVLSERKKEFDRLEVKFDLEYGYCVVVFLKGKIDPRDVPHIVFMPEGDIPVRIAVPIGFKFEQAEFN